MTIKRTYIIEFIHYINFSGYKIQYHYCEGQMTYITNYYVSKFHDVGYVFEIKSCQQSLNEYLIKHFANIFCFLNADLFYPM